MQVSLAIVAGKHSGMLVPVTVPKFFIGQTPNCHLRSTSRSISRQHCVILVGLCVVAVRDLGSRNGTWVNGEQVKGHRFLQNGDRLATGSLEFEVRLAASPVDDPSSGRGEGSRDNGPHEVSEQEQEARRRHDPIVGVSKAAQARRASATSTDAAADALWKYSHRDSPR